MIPELNKTGINQVLVVAGPTIATAMLKQGLMDELVMYQAPSLLGQGKSFVADFGANSIDQMMELDHISSEVIDGDVKSIFAIRGEK